MPKLEISRVHDAYAEGADCPLCTLIDGAEHTYLVSFQHSRVMEPNVRVKTNAVGFCPDHLGKLGQGENKLGFALVVLSHLREKSPDLCSALDGLIEAARSGAKERTRKTGQIMQSLEAFKDSCFICDLLTQDMARYSWTILYLWSKDKQFPSLFRASRGFCLSHFCTVLATADQVRSALARTLQMLSGRIPRQS